MYGNMTKHQKSLQRLAASRKVTQRVFVNLQNQKFDQLYQYGYFDQLKFIVVTVFVEP